MKIEVKCERCRFRFTTEAEPGMSELTCVCPRCGTPFTVKVNPEETDAHSEVETTTSTPPADSEPVAPSATPKPQPQPQVVETTPPPMPRRKPAPQPAWLRTEPNLRQPKQPKKKHHYLMKILLGLLALYFFITFLVYKCTSHEDKMTDAAQVSMHNETTAEANEDAVDTTEIDEFTRVDAQPTPDWVQGTWQLKTSYGLITVSIDGNKINETISYEEEGTKKERTSDGTFYFADDRLYCDGMSEDNHQMVYDLDLAHHCLLIGDKQMKKQ